MQKILQTIFLLAVMLVSGPARATVLDRIVAVVNDDVITLTELKSVETAMLRTAPPLQGEEWGLSEQERILKNLIDKKIQLQKAKELGIETSNATIDQTIKGIMEKNGISEETLREKVTAEGFTWSDYKKEIGEQMTLTSLVNQEVRSRIVLLPEDLERYYRENQQQFVLEKKKHLRRILLALPESATPSDADALRGKAESLRADLLGGADFKELAIRHSDGPEAKDGGDIGYFADGELMSELDRAVSAMEAGDISPVIEHNGGFTLLKVEEVKDTETVPFDDAKEDIQEVIYQEKLGARYESWIKELREKAFVEIKL